MIYLRPLHSSKFVSFYETIRSNSPFEFSHFVAASTPQAKLRCPSSISWPAKGAIFPNFRHLHRTKFVGYQTTTLQMLFVRECETRSTKSALIFTYCASNIERLEFQKNFASFVHLYSRKRYRHKH